MRRLLALAAAGWLACAPAALADPRHAQVAGSFYPGDAKELRATVEQLLAQYQGIESPSKPRALILPHAGYMFAGPVAARGIHEVQGRHYDGVVVVGFTHQRQFPGASVDNADAYETPLGTIPVDTDAVKFLRSQPGFDYVEGAHSSGEHSLEVMLPYLQVALGAFKLVPVLMGGYSFNESSRVADGLVKLAARGDYLFIFSTDLSHYHTYEQAVEQDRLTTTALTRETSAAVNQLFDGNAVEACGRGPIQAGVLFAEQLGYLDRVLLLYKNSGDTSGDKTRVVGYAAIAMREPADAGGTRISEEAGQALVRAAREVIQTGIVAHANEHEAILSDGLEKIGGKGTAPPKDWVMTADLPATVLKVRERLGAIAELRNPRGLFVTLRKAGELRGCIGRVYNSEIPLAQLLPDVALDAALRDPRFPPLQNTELDQVTVEISVLSVPQRIRSPEQIVAGRDGVLLTSGVRSGVFLPQVWQESGWTRKEFLSQLAVQKAGLPLDGWQDAALYTFQDQAFDEIKKSDQLEK